MGGVFAFAISGLPVALAQAENNETTSSSRQAERPSVQVREMVLSNDRFELQRGSTTTATFSLDQLKQLMEQRKQELSDEEESTTPQLRNVMKNANEVRLAVHALLASKELLGGIGPQVSEIARHMNDSVATTTNAEARIKSRGFVVRLFFGGDKKASKDISKEVERNSKNVAKLTELLNSANLQDEVKAMMEAQVTALKAEQDRLQATASAESKRWGFFSWRFR